MDIKQLRHFIAIYKYGSIAKAAEKLYISQQGLSCSLLRMEAELSYRLLNRTPNGMTLTAEGKSLLPMAEKLVAEFEDLEMHAEKLIARRSIIKIGSTLGAIFKAVAPFWIGFQSLYPQYTIEVIEVGDHECDKLIENGEVDLAFGTSPFDERIFDCTSVYTSPFCLLLHKNRALPGLKTVTIDFLRDAPIMIMNDTSKTNLIVTNACKANGFLPQIQYSAAEVIAIHRMVSLNAGMGISVTSVAEDLADPNVVIIPFEEPNMLWNVNMFKLKDRALAPETQKFENFVLEHLHDAASLLTETQADDNG